MRWGTPPHPVIVAMRDNGDYTRAPLSSYHTTIAGWGWVHLNYKGFLQSGRPISSFLFMISLEDMVHSEGQA